MGSIRTLLAISVVFAHMGGSLTLVGGQYAVELFYIISGFLMSLILVEVKAYSSVKDFYFSRYLRLFPVYAVVAIGSLIIYLIFGYDVFFLAYAGGDYITDALLVLSNATLFGQAQVYFVSQTDGILHYSISNRLSDIEIWRGLLVPQAWTLELEVMFYLIAPFILSKRKLLFFLLIFSLGIGVFIAYVAPGTGVFLTQRFFPTELAFFILGALTHQTLFPWFRANIKGNYLNWIPSLSVLCFVVYTIAFPHLPRPSLIVSLFYTLSLFAAFLILLPLFALFQNRHKWDSKIGNLSYPIYICHWLPVAALTTRFGQDIYQSIVISLAMLAGVIMVAYCLDIFVAQKVERVRRTLRNRNMD